MSGAWKRVPAFLPNLTLKLLPLSEAQRSAYEATGFVKDLVFKTTPQATKFDIKKTLEQVYGLRVARVDTVNYQGKKKRSKDALYRRADYKKAYVTLKSSET